MLWRGLDQKELYGSHLSIHLLVDRGGDWICDSLDIIGVWVLGGEEGGVEIGNNTFDFFLVQSEDIVDIFQDVNAISFLTFSGRFVKIGSVTIPNRKPVVPRSLFLVDHLFMEKFF